jgi:hypothetical protein
MVSIAPFRFDVTPPLGHALLGGLVKSAIAIDDNLEAIGYILLTNEKPIVVCVLDWAGLMNGSHLAFRSTLADAAGTTPERVALQCVHQHNAPFVCEKTRVIAARHPELPPLFDPEFFTSCLERGANAVRYARQHPRPITHIAHGQTDVTNVASNRRVDRDRQGKVRSMRGSACEDPEQVALPAGNIDPSLQTIAYFSGEEKVVSCHYYATHPMSYYRDGRVTSDFCGLARKRRQTEEPHCTHLYFTGCAGNIAAGKYNDGSPAARNALTQRMYDAIVASESNLKSEPLWSLRWRHTSVITQSRPPPSADELGTTVGGPEATRIGKLLHAYWESWQQRCEHVDPLLLSCLRLNELSVLHLPGEPFVDYQLRAQTFRPEQPVLVAAYGDGGPWYIPTAAEYPSGGYETTVAFSKPTIDGQLTRAIESLLS